MPQIVIREQNNVFQLGKTKWASYLAADIVLFFFCSSYFCARRCMCLVRWVDSQVLCAPNNCVSTVTHIQSNILHCNRTLCSHAHCLPHVHHFSLEYRFLFLTIISHSWLTASLCQTRISLMFCFIEWMHTVAICAIIMHENGALCLHKLLDECKMHLHRFSIARCQWMAIYAQISNIMSGSKSICTYELYAKMPLLMINSPFHSATFCDDAHGTQ